MADGNGDLSLYRRLLGYVVPHTLVFVVSIVGFVVYSIGNVLLADLLQFLLDSLGEDTPGSIGIVESAVNLLWPKQDQTLLEYARIAVPIAAVTLASSAKAFGDAAGSL